MMFAETEPEGDAGRARRELKKMASRNPAEGIIALLNGMMARPSETLL
ncbi:MAG: hypothetical protein MZV63_10550 [Marinilabiliales bacterium]|nr:hypothetical protein [Marinilabiliales bacterium]